MKLRKFILLLAALSAATFLTLGAGCNTSRGFGQDVEDAGEGIQDATD